MDGDEGAGAGTAIGHRLHDQRRLEPAEPDAARVLRHIDAAEAQGDLDLGEVYTRTELFLEKYKKQITIGVGALIAVVGGAIAYKKFVVEPKANEAAELIWKAQYYFEFSPRGCLKWLNAAALAEEARRVG